MGKIDKVLVDAPCMGFGTVRRNPDLLWKYNEENLASITKDQFEILSHASRLVKPNGELIYATCSILKEENEDIINRFIKTNKEFKVKEMDYFFEKSKINEKSNFLKTFPNYDQMDGFLVLFLLRQFNSTFSAHYCKIRDKLTWTYTMNLLDKISLGFIELPWYGYLVVALTLTHITIAAVTIYLHRYSAHKSLELNFAIKHFFRFWLWLTTGMKTKNWTAIHRKHHAKCETEDDPHSPQVPTLKVFFEGAELYRKEGKNKETLDNYGHGTPDDWLEKICLQP